MFNYLHDVFDFDAHNPNLNNADSTNDESSDLDDFNEQSDGFVTEKREIYLLPYNNWAD